MAQTTSPDLWRPMVGAHLEEHRKFAGRYIRIPILLSPEARARRGWDDAVAWLEAREAARVEWPWPERS